MGHELGAARGAAQRLWRARAEEHDDLPDNTRPPKVRKEPLDREGLKSKLFQMADFDGDGKLIDHEFLVWSLLTGSPYQSTGNFHDVRREASENDQQDETEGLSETMLAAMLDGTCPYLYSTNNTHLSQAAGYPVKQGSEGHPGFVLGGPRLYHC